MLELILRSDHPTGAYALLAQLLRGRGKLGPPIIYRALDFLVAHKLIHKIETSSTFIACGDVEHPHKSQFMICEDCGATEEIQDDKIVWSLHWLGEGRGFAAERQGYRSARIVLRLPLRAPVIVNPRPMLVRRSQGCRALALRRFPPFAA